MHDSSCRRPLIVQFNRCYVHFWTSDKRPSQPERLLCAVMRDGKWMFFYQELMISPSLIWIDKHSSTISKENNISIIQQFLNRTRSFAKPRKRDSLEKSLPHSEAEAFHVLHNNLWDSTAHWSRKLEKLTPGSDVDSRYPRAPFGRLY